MISVGGMTESDCVPVLEQLPDPMCRNATRWWHPSLVLWKLQ